jgi:hypothetical protein
MPRRDEDRLHFNPKENVFLLDQKEIFCASIQKLL